MCVKKSLCCVLFQLMLVAGTALAEDAPAKMEKTDASASTTASPNAMPVDDWLPGLSNYMQYHQPCCCGPIGGDGPILSELYLRTGASFPVAGGTLRNTLDAGWEIQGGGRSLFFNPAGNAAWVADLSLANIHNNGNRPNLTFPLLGNPVNVRALNRTFVSAGLGREWYLLAPAKPEGFNWRFGIDGGGRLGAARLDMNDPSQASGFRRHSDILGGLYFAPYTDVEIPCGCCTFTGGFRVEWDYNWMDIVPAQTSNVEDINFLVTAGVRF